ncbi:MAG: DNA gyrase inhibitor YacG [Planctomycetota bacterium]|nr:DNA gyrase inhibitor YacG [Planctomycetota bacterium]
MIAGKCPTCGKRFEVATIAERPSFPFCSDRCRLVDLGRWIDGENRIPGPAASDETEDDQKAEAEHGPVDEDDG